MNQLRRQLHEGRVLVTVVCSCWKSVLDRVSTCIIMGYWLLSPDLVSVFASLSECKHLIILWFWYLITWCFSYCKVNESQLPCLVEITICSNIRRCVRLNWLASQWEIFQDDFNSVKRSSDQLALRFKWGFTVTHWACRSCDLSWVLGGLTRSGLLCLTSKG